MAKISVPKEHPLLRQLNYWALKFPGFVGIRSFCSRSLPFCMVKIEGMPKLQIACNTACTEGMKVTTTSDEVKDAHKWALEFHLINHPLDCPICDQAGE